MKTLKNDIEIIIDLNLFILLKWLNEQKILERFEKDEIAYSTAIIKMRSKAIADAYIAKEMNFSDKNHKVKLFLEARADVIYAKYSQFDHDSCNAC